MDSSPWNSAGQNTGVDSFSLLQGIFPTQGSNPDLPHCRRILYQLSHKGSPRILEWVSSVHFSSVTQSCLTLWDPVDWSPPGSCIIEFSKQGYWSGLPFPSSQARILEWVAISFSSGSSQPRYPALQADSSASEPPGKHCCQVGAFPWIYVKVEGFCISPIAECTKGVAWLSLEYWFSLISESAPLGHMPTSETFFFNLL